jgi:hypothetical protein
VTFRGGHRLNVFENRVQRRIFEPKRDDIRVDCRKMHNERLHTLYSSTNIIRMIRSWGIRQEGNVAAWREEERM